MSFIKRIFEQKMQRREKHLLEGLNSNMNLYGQKYGLDFDGQVDQQDLDQDLDNEDGYEYVDVDELDATQLAQEIEDLKHDLEMALDQNDDPEIINQIVDNLKCIKSCIEDRLEQLESECGPGEECDDIDWDDQNEVNDDTWMDLEQDNDLNVSLQDDDFDDYQNDQNYQDDQYDQNDMDEFGDMGEFDNYNRKNFEDEECTTSDCDKMGAFDSLFKRARMDEAKAVDVDRAKSHRQRVDSILRSKGSSTHADKTKYDRKQNAKIIKDQVKMNEAAKSKGNPELAKYVNAASWPKDLEAAKQYGHEAIKQWDWTEKAAKYHRLVDAATTVTKVQSIVINTLLSGEGLKVIK